LSIDLTLFPAYLICDDSVNKIEKWIDRTRF